MSYTSNRNYNTRTSGRFNTPGNFVAAGQLTQQSPQNTNNVALPQRNKSRNSIGTTGSLNNSNENFVNMYENPPLPPTDPIETDVEMKPQDEDSANGEAARPPWMKSKLAGVKKISNKERRRRQNENLRRLLTPKNALMVLNEMMPGEQLNNQFKVVQVPTQCYGPMAGPNFSADLQLEGNHYKGYGENKMMARITAAEQAIRDLIIKKLSKACKPDAAAGASGASEEEEESLPMIQLASFALHKLFTEWQMEGHKVPQFKPNAQGAAGAATTAPGGAAGAGGAAAGAGATKPAKVPVTRPVPAGALEMHPCSLLTHMRPGGVPYRELGAEGEPPRNMVFTIGVDVDGSTFIGKGPSKKEARRMAARAACISLFNVQYPEPVKA